MKKNESKTTQAAAAAAEQPENTQSVEAAKTPDAQSETGGDMERPDDDTSAESEQPRDGKGCEAVTVVIIAHDEKHGELIARSVMANLRGADADVHLVSGEHLKETDAETLLAHLPHVETERLIVMTDGMVILNPVTIYEIGCRRGNLTEKGVTVGENRTPKLMHKSVLEKMLPEMIATYANFDVALEYDEYARSQVAPVIMRPWDQDSWLLPVISKNPPLEALQKWAKTQRFAWIAPHSWTDTVVKFLEERFPA